MLTDFARLICQHLSGPNLDLMLSILLRLEENTNEVCKLSCQEVFSARIVM